MTGRTHRKIRTGSNTIFTQLQHNSNLRWPPNNACLPKKNVFIHIQDDPSKIICLLRKNVLHLIAYTYTKYVRCYLPLSNSVTVSIFTVSAFIILTLNPNIPILSTAIPQHTTISFIHCTGYTALLKTLHNQFWWDALSHHYDTHWLNTILIFLGL